VASGYEMRVSDAEREAAASELREHFASGRLDQEELDERLTAVFAAKTRSDLNALFTDLPSSGHGWGSASGPFGPGQGRPAAWSYPGSRDDQSWQGSDSGYRRSAGRTIRSVVLTGVMMWALLIVGIFGVFGVFGTGRPIGIVLILAAFAMLRRLLLVIFGRRRVGGPRGPRRRR